MKTESPFDKKLEVLGSGIPEDVREAAIFVTDTLDLCEAAPRAVFEDKATPEVAIAIYDRLRARMGEAPPEARVANGR